MRRAQNGSIVRSDAGSFRMMEEVLKVEKRGWTLLSRNAGLVVVLLPLGDARTVSNLLYYHYSC